jgi:hypothetical protein
MIEVEAKSDLWNKLNEDWDKRWELGIDPPFSQDEIGVSSGHDESAHETAG